MTSICLDITQQPTDHTSDQTADETTDQTADETTSCFRCCSPESTCCREAKGEFYSDGTSKITIFPKTSNVAGICIVCSEVLLSCGLIMLDEDDTINYIYKYEKQRGCLACMCCPLSTVAVVGVSFPLCCIATSGCCLWETTYGSIAYVINKIRGTLDNTSARAS